MSNISDIIDFARYPLHDLDGFARECNAQLDQHGVLVLPGFIHDAPCEQVKVEADNKKHLAFFCEQNHTVYLSAPDPSYPADHPRNRQVVSTKGCITDDQISQDSPLRTIYDSEVFRDFLGVVLGESELYPYADRLSSLNFHYYESGQELGWHFDNSSFAITLMIQTPLDGGKLEYVKRLRDSATGDMNFDGVGAVLDGSTEPNYLVSENSTLVLFRGRDTLHRVTPIQGERERIQVVLAYNTQPGISLSKEASLTFYGRVG
jgi:hypothetical protein